MEIVRQPSPWDHLAVFDDRELLGWVEHYRGTELPRWQEKLRDAGRDHLNVPCSATGRKLRSVTKDYHRTRKMLKGLEAEARKRGLIK